MKHLVYLAILFICSSLQAQSFNGHIVYGDTTLNYQVRLTETDNQTKAFYSSLAMNAFEIPCQNTTFEKDSLTFYVMSDYYTYAYQLSGKGEDLNGQLNIYSNETEKLLNTFETYLVRDKVIASEGIKREEFSFISNNLTLHGTLWYPQNPINKGLLFVTSSQGHDRSGSNAEANYFASLGYTVFNYDKRGTGQSEGDWQSATIEELCSDDMNALEFFSNTSSLSLSDMGIKGSSQGGIKIPYILSKMPGLGFGISVSCPSGTLMESDLNHWKNTHDDKIDKANMEQALEVQKAGYNYLAGNISYKSLLETKNENSNKDWLQYVWIPDENIQKDDKLNFSGLPYFEKITQPILVIQGMSDEIIPKNSYQVIENAIQTSNSTDYKVIVLENTSHSMMSLNHEFPYFQLLAHDYLTVITNWLENINRR
jgi:alpha/beta superfamily hydrolase